MHSKDTEILEFNDYQKSDEAPFVIYADLECLIEKTDGCKNNFENLSTKNVRKHIPSAFSVFSVSLISLYRSIEYKHDVYRGNYCMKRFCESFREHTLKIINFKKKNMKSLTKVQQESYANAKICYTCKEKLENKYFEDKKYLKVRDHRHYTGK